ncbi:MAG: type IV secretory system conjugative DNA transfer family protein [Verrucomicrobiae bacterium]|nr:type IV secretory system conjugative DNA transfer family protein [Verrucomicrobiae bacterium]
MILIYFIASVLSLCLFWFFHDIPVVGLASWLFLPMAAWLFWTGLKMMIDSKKGGGNSSGGGSKKNSNIVCQLDRFKWDMNNFCRGWFIPGKTGCGKTQSAIMNIMYQVTKNVPNWGGVCVDQKGLFWEILMDMMKHMGREKDTILLQCRPDHAPPDWKPKYTWNPLSDKTIPYSTHAKNICNVAESLGQSEGQAFFKTQTLINVEMGFRLLDAAGYPVTLKNTFMLLTDPQELDDVLAEAARLHKQGKFPLEAEDVVVHFVQKFKTMPPETLSGIRGTIFNYLKFFTDPIIAEIFCPQEDTFHLDALDEGKIVCVSIPQKYATERKYINTLLKLAYYNHAVRRFDQPAEKRKNHNMLILWADEAQQIITASEDGVSDHDTLGVIREAKCTAVFATQSYTSLLPPLKDEKKGKVLALNLSNVVMFTAADEDTAKFLSDLLGKRKFWKRSYNRGGGKGGQSVNRSEEDKYWYEPYELRNLKKFHVVINHCEQGFNKKPILLKPLGPDGKVPAWFSRWKC